MNFELIFIYFNQETVFYDSKRSTEAHDLRCTIYSGFCSDIYSEKWDSQMHSESTDLDLWG